MLNTGDTAPEFSGQDQFGNTYHLSSFHGWRVVLIAFYPYDWSPICSIQMLEFQRDLELFKAAGVLILGISVDSIYSHKAWAEKHGIQFPLLSDYNRKISHSYGTLNEKGSADRTVFIIGKDGKIKHVKCCRPGEKPSTESLLNKIKRMKESEDL